MMLQGGVTYEEGRERDREYIASIMYEYPKAETKIIEMPLEYYNPMPVYTIEKPVIVREERKEESKTNRIKPVRRNEVKIPARERIDYINKLGNVKDFGVPQVNENIVMKAKTKKIQAPLKDYNEIANLMYPSMEEKSQIQVKKKEPILLGDAKTLKEEVLSISDVEKTLFKGGMMGNRPLEKIQPVAKNRKQDRNYEEIANLMYPSMEEERYYWDEKGNIFEKNPEDTLNWSEKQKRKLQVLSDNIEKWLNNSDIESEEYKQKVNLILSLIAAPLGGGAVLNSNISKLLVPIMGRKIGQTMAGGIGSGLTSGAVEGIGRGIIEGGNPIKTMLQDAITVGVIGAAGGYGLGKVGQNIAGKALQKYKNLDELNLEQRIEFRKTAKKYYKDYIQDTEIDKDGKIVFTKRGHKELSRWNPKQAVNYPTLKKDIKNSVKIADRKNIDKSKPFLKKFDVYQGENGQHLIGVYSDNKRNYYFTNDSIPISTQ